MTTHSTQHPPFWALRQFTRPSAPGEHCEMCGAKLSSEHEHLVQIATRKLFCCCNPCFVTLSGRQKSEFKRVAKRIARLGEFSISDEQWLQLSVPINLAFFFESSPNHRVVAMFPSPAGVTESEIDAVAWNSMAAANPVLRQLEPDTEALLVNRMFGAHDYFIAPIDMCYQLAGLVRLNWRGFSGGPEMRTKINEFFTAMDGKSLQPTTGGPYA